MSVTPGLDGIPSHPASPLSLGEIHQQLENEQEAQVNRLLNLIKDQQDQIAVLQTTDKSPNPTANEPNHSQQQQPLTPVSPSHTDANAAYHFRSSSSVLSTLNSRSPSLSTRDRAPSPRHHRPSFTRTVSSQSYTSSHASQSAAGSPFIRPRSSIGQDHDDRLPLGRSTLDESAFNSTETASLQKENMMLKNRIKELERQLADTAVQDSTAQASQPTAATQ